MFIHGSYLTLTKSVLHPWPYQPILESQFLIGLLFFRLWNMHSATRKNEFRSLNRVGNNSAQTFVCRNSASSFLSSLLVLHSSVSTSFIYLSLSSSVTHQVPTLDYTGYTWNWNSWVSPYFKVYGPLLKSPISLLSKRSELCILGSLPPNPMFNEDILRLPRRFWQ